MKQNFLQRLDDLETHAKDEILALLSDKLQITLFEAHPTAEEEWTKDIYDEIPDFAYYSKYGYMSHAAIQIVKYSDNDILVTGILKGDNYPDEVTVNLNEMESYYILALADYLLSDSI